MKKTKQLVTITGEGYRADGSRPLSKKHRELYAGRLYATLDPNYVAEIRLVAGSSSNRIYAGYLWKRNSGNEPEKIIWNGKPVDSGNPAAPHGFMFEPTEGFAESIRYIVDDATTNDLATELFRKPTKPVAKKPEYRKWTYSDISSNIFMNAVFMYEEDYDPDVDDGFVEQYKATSLKRQLNGSSFELYIHGKWMTAEFLLNNMRYSLYDPTTGQFTSYRKCGVAVSDDEGDC